METWIWTQNWTPRRPSQRPGAQKAPTKTRTQFQAPRRPFQCLGAHATSSAPIFAPRRPMTPLPCIQHQCTAAFWRLGAQTTLRLAPRRPTDKAVHKPTAPAPKHEACLPCSGA
ncbi:hypothetical protein PIB30_007402 [Stylosanthes scabra]|uniref:Uncharacterized protein n=1 Tax=Stylosanthes scabra TaxID=79078 RepID=A0ABU6Q4H4_9FABA|nr:hypothetical protein [Stylosanthes scabra]